MNAKKKFDHRNDLVLLPLGGTGEIEIGRAHV